MTAPFKGEIVLYRELAGRHAVCCMVTEIDPAIELTYLGPTRPQDSLVHGQVIAADNATYLETDDGSGHAFFSAAPGMAAFLPKTPDDLATAPVLASLTNSPTESEAGSETPADDAAATPIPAATPVASSPDAAPAASDEQPVPTGGEAAPVEPSEPAEPPTQEG